MRSSRSDEREMERAARLALRSSESTIVISGALQPDLSVSERLAPLAPDDAVVVAESGVFGPGDVERLHKAGAHAVLVGEGLVTAPDRAAASQGAIEVAVITQPGTIVAAFRPWQVIRSAACVNRSTRQRLPAGADLIGLFSRQRDVEVPRKRHGPASPPLAVRRTSELCFQSACSSMPTFRDIAGRPRGNGHRCPPTPETNRQSLSDTCQRRP